MRYCNFCGKPKHKGLCDMAKLSDGRVVHVSRIEMGGDLHDQIGDDLKIVNRWKKKNLLEKKKK